MEDGEGEHATLGPFDVEPIPVNHSIPDAVGVTIDTTLTRVRSLSFADIAAAALPAVASIASTGVVSENQQQPEGVDPFEFFFGPRGRGNSPGQPRQRRGHEDQQRAAQTSGDRRKHRFDVLYSGGPRHAPMDASR